MIHTDGIPTIAHYDGPVVTKTKPRRDWALGTVYVITDSSGTMKGAYDREDDAYEAAMTLRALTAVWAEVHPVRMYTRVEET